MNAEADHKEYLGVWEEYLDAIDRKEVQDIDVKKAVDLRKRMMRYERAFDAMSRSRRRELDEKHRQERIDLVTRQFAIMGTQGDGALGLPRGGWIQLRIEMEAQKDE
jgi:hypothetical protein